MLRRYLVLVLVLLLFPVVIGISDNLSLFYGSCPYYKSIDLIESAHNLKYSISLSDAEYGHLTNLASNDSSYDAISDIYYTVNWEVVKFSKYRKDGESVILYGKAGNRIVKVRYTPSESLLNTTLTVQSSPGEWLDIRVYVKICDMKLVIVKSKPYYFVQAGSVAYAFEFPHCRMMYTSGSMIFMMRRKSEATNASFSFGFYVDNDIQSLKEKIYPDEPGVPVYTYINRKNVEDAWDSAKYVP